MTFRLRYALGIPLLAIASLISIGNRGNAENYQQQRPSYNHNEQQPNPFSVQPSSNPEPLQQCVRQILEKSSSLDSIIETYCSQRNFDSDLIRGQIKQESGFNPRAKSKAGAIGLAQIMPATALELGYKPEEMYEPRKAIEAETRYLSKLRQYVNDDSLMAGLSEFEKLKLILASYNAGFSNIGDACRIVNLANATPRGTRQFYIIQRGDRQRRVDISKIRGYEFNWIGFSAALELVTGAKNTEETTGYVRAIITNYNRYKAEKGEWRKQLIIPPLKVK
jgi:hypothetical protein